VSWRKNNLPITPHTAPGVVLSPNRYSLIIPNVRPHDAGHYQCASTNRAGRNERDFHLRVLGEFIQRIEHKWVTGCSHSWRYKILGDVTG